MARSVSLYRMKSLGVVGMVLAVAPLWAGVRVQVEVTDKAGKVTERDEILLDSDRLRFNTTTAEGTRRSLLFLTDGGRDRMVILEPARNEYREIDQQAMNQAVQQMQGLMAQLQAQLANLPPEQRARMEQMMKGRMGQAASAPAPITYTAKESSSVNGFVCMRYEGTRGAEKVADVCAAKPADVHFSASDFQALDKMRKFGANLASNNPLLSGMKTDYLLQAGFEGYPVETINYSGGQATTKWDVKSIERASFSDADFSLGNARKAELIPQRPAKQ